MSLLSHDLPYLSMLLKGMSITVKKTECEKIQHPDLCKSSRHECRGSLQHRKQYITPINKAYNESFENMDEFKHEANFKRCLKKLTLGDVIEAVKRAKTIMDNNEKNGYTLYQYRGYSYYKENPSLMIWEIVEKILVDCELM